MDPKGRLEREKWEAKTLCLHLQGPALSINQLLEDQEDLRTEWSAVKQDGVFVVTIYLMSRFRTNSTAPHNMGSERGFLGWVIKGRAGGCLLQSPTERSPGQGLCWICIEGLPSEERNCPLDVAGEEKVLLHPLRVPGLV